MRQKLGADLFESTARRGWGKSGRLALDGCAHGRCRTPTLVIQGEVNNETRPDRYRKRGHFGCDHWDGGGECTALSPLRPGGNLCTEGLSIAKPRLGSPRHSAPCSVFRPEQSGSHRRW